MSCSTLGLVVSIPIVIAGSAIILALLERFPILIWGGAGVLGWVAGEIFASDQVVLNFFSGYDPEHVALVAQIVGVGVRARLRLHLAQHAQTAC